MPYLKKVLEDARYRFRWLRNYYRNGRNIRTVLFYPQFPSKSTVLYKIFKKLNYNITNNPGKVHSLTVYWEDATVRSANKLIREISNSERVINLNSLNISKSFVDKVFEAVFGYSSLVDPEIFCGLMVRKNEKNAAHDGKIIQGPAEAEEGFIYQKLINNECEGGLVADMRIPVIKATLPLVFIKYKTLDTRFGVFRKWHHKIKNVEVHKPEDLLSEDEITKLIVFCRKSGLDYGEMDVLRDKDDGRIYVVDVNNTPTGPPKMNKNQSKKALSIMSDLFVQAFLKI